jgi:hypothetical protein
MRIAGWLGRRYGMWLYGEEKGFGIACVVLMGYWGRGVG